MLNLQYGLSDQVMQDLISCFKQSPHIEQVRIFGSRANNSYKDGSDIDLAVFAKNMSPAEFTTLWGSIEDLPIVFKIDLLHWDHLTNPELKEKILSEGKVIYPE